jgi:hypothetical protein
MTIRLVPAFAALLVLLGAPAMAGADHKNRDHGLVVKVDGDGGFWFGWRRHQHAHVSHRQEYRRIEHDLIEKRARLLKRTRNSLEREEFETTQQRLVRLVKVDQALHEHRGAHRRCSH